MGVLVIERFPSADPSRRRMDHAIQFSSMVMADIKKAWTPAFAKIHANFENPSTKQTADFARGVRARRKVKIKAEA